MKNTKKMIFAALLLFSTTLFVQAQSEEKGRHNPEEMASKRTERMVEKYALTDGQAQQVEALFLKMAKKKMALKEEDTDRSQKKATMKKVRAEMTKEMKGILTPEQFSKWNTVSADGSRGKHRGRHGKGRHHKEFKEATKAYREQNVIPVLRAQRAKLETKISAEDKATLANLRSKIEAKRAEHKKNRGEKLDKDMPREGRAKGHGHGAERKEIKALVDKYQSEIDVLLAEIEPQAAIWKKDMKAIMETQRAKKGEERRERKDKTGKGDRKHGKGKHKVLHAGRFLLLDPVE